jgi:hypothetical protein
MGKAVLLLDLQFLHELLELPKDCQIVEVNYRADNKALELALESENLPAWEHPPLAHALCSVEYHPENREFTKRSVRVEVAMPEGAKE